MTVSSVERVPRWSARCSSRDSAMCRSPSGTLVMLPPPPPKQRVGELWDDWTLFLFLIFLII